MKRSLFFILFFSIQNIYSQTDTTLLDEILVHASKVPAVYQTSSRQVTLLTNEDLKNMPVQSFSEILDYQVTVDSRQRGVAGVQSDISIRGGSFEQTLILLNGIKMNDPQTGHHSMNIPIDFSSIERIEILNGPGSRVYGTNAFCGAINIITRNEKTNRAYFSINGGQFGYYNTSLSLNQVHKNWSNYLALNKSASDGYISNTDFKVLNLFYQSVYNLKNGFVQLQTGILDKAFGANSFYTPKYPQQFELIRSMFGNIKISAGDQLKFTSDIYWRRHNDKFELFRETPGYYSKQGNFWVNGEDTAKYVVNNYEKWNYYSGHNYHLTDIYGGELNLQYTSVLGKSAIGFEFRSEKILSNKLGDLLSERIGVKNEEDVFYLFGKTRNNLGFFAEQNLLFKKASISLGTYIHYNSQYKWNWYSGLDASYEITPCFRVFTSINQSVRLPSFTDLYYQSATNIGNPELIPERATAFEAGIKYFGRAIQGNAALFRRYGKNMIDWVRLPDQAKWKSLNLTEITTDGLEININFIPGEQHSDFFCIRKVNIGYSLLNLNKQSQQYISNYVLDYLKHKLIFGLTHKFFDKIGADWKMIFQDRAGTFTFFDIETNTNGSEISYKPFFLLDTRFFMDFKPKNSILHGNIFFEITNLFDNKYFDFGNIEMPGRWIKVGISVEIATLSK